MTESAAVEEPKHGPRSIADLIATVSASRLTLFHACRLKFYFRYILGLIKPKSAALHVGSAVHEVLKFWNRARWKGEQPSLKQFHDVYSNRWSSSGTLEPVRWEVGEEDEEKKVGWRLLETYFRESEIPPDEKPEAVEVSVEADLARHGLPKLVGIIDLVRPRGRIVDYKSAGKTPDAAMVRHTTETQTSSYSILYRSATGRGETGIELHHLVKTKSPKLIISRFAAASEGQVHRLLHVTESYVEGLQRRDFVPSPGIQCASCEYFTECRAWS